MRFQLNDARAVKQGPGTGKNHALKQSKNILMATNCQDTDTSDSSEAGCGQVPVGFSRTHTRFTANLTLYAASYALFAVEFPCGNRAVANPATVARLLSIDRF